MGQEVQEREQTEQRQCVCLQEFTQVRLIRQGKSETLRHNERESVGGGWVGMKTEQNDKVTVAGGDSCV